MARQLVLDLPFRAAMGRSDFFVSDANAAAVAGVEAWRDWPLSKMVLVGPAGSGKTHLTHVFCDQSGARLIAARDIGAFNPTDLAETQAIAIEDADQIAGAHAAQEALFHLHNACAHRNVALLVTARSAPARWGLSLPDLDSRMQQAGQLTLAAPDDQLIAAVLVKLAADRQMALTPALLGYILPRIERSLAQARDFIARLDAEALADKQRPGLKHVRAILARDEG
ncbi:DnaA/Hda family protein [Roseicyclus sp.]|uniref:DnaA ATPase domain-containing protein n=1 Tax=Roseicyclus sp. TaxID=1914329 RepID=UPI001BCCACBD|nr:DnaA/Hda family protein [Roseicyclus sp.]